MPSFRTSPPDQQDTLVSTTNPDRRCCLSQTRGRRAPSPARRAGMCRRDGQGRLCLCQVGKAGPPLRAPPPPPCRGRRGRGDGPSHCKGGEPMSPRRRWRGQHRQRKRVAAAVDAHTVGAAPQPPSPPLASPAPEWAPPQPAPPPGACVSRAMIIAVHSRGGRHPSTPPASRWTRGTRHAASKVPPPPSQGVIAYYLRPPPTGASPPTLAPSHPRKAQESLEQPRS